MRHAVILAGGSGVRFWPVSRKDRPKQFLPLGGGQSLLRDTFERLAPLVPPERVWVVTASEHARKVARELPEIDRRRILREPVGRNTAPAIHLAALAVLGEDPEATLLVVPADAWVPRPEPYRRALRAAMRAAEGGDRLVLVGVKPTRPETGYGYIDPGSKLGRGPARSVRRFEEKPTAAKAKKFVTGGRHLWNCGIFAGRARSFVKAVDRHLPELASAFAPLRSSRRTVAAIATAYRRAPAVSVDYGILERAANVAVVPASFTWDDLGSWRALERLGRGGTYLRGPVAVLDSPGLIAWAEGGVVAVVGVSDVVVVHTPDATLVVAKDRAQDVRKIVEALLASPQGRQLVEGRKR